MSNIAKRRRKRTGSTSARYHPSTLVVTQPTAPSPVGKAEVAACFAVGLVAIALIALIWIVTFRAVQEQRADIRDHAEQALASEAADIAETVAHELVMIDQSLTILAAAWKLDSDQFDLNRWQRDMPALTAVADDLFVSDENHIVQQDILPQAVGQGVGAAYVDFPHGSLETFRSDGSRDTASVVLQADVGAPIDARQFLMYVVRPLDHPPGWLIGASYRSAELTRLFAESQLGNNPVVALVDTRRGVLQAVVGPAARRPHTDLSKTPLFESMKRSPAGTWLGPTAIDDMERLHAFRRVTDRDMVVLVGSSFAEVMAPAENLAAGTRAVAFVATGLVLAVAVLVCLELFSIRSAQRRKRTAARNRGELERLRAEQSLHISRAAFNAARLQAVLDGTSDGLALFDSELRLTQWNHPFSRGIGIEPRTGMPLDTLLREQAACGLFGPTEDVEAEIARRVGILRAGDTAGVSHPGPDHETLILRGLPIAAGGFILLLNGLSVWQAPPPPPPSSESMDPDAPEPAAPAVIEW